MTTRGPGQLLTIAELVVETGIPRETLYRLVASGELAHVRTVGGPGKQYRTRGRIRIQRSDWDDWIARHRTPAKTDRDAPTAASAPRKPTLDLPGADMFLT